MVGFYNPTDIILKYFEKTLNKSAYSGYYEFQVHASISFNRIYTFEVGKLEYTHQFNYKKRFIADGRIL